jgi:hypothetical protein
MLDVILRRFETPDEIRRFEKGSFALVTLGGVTIGRATYQPGWRWSVDVGRDLGATHCTVARGSGRRGPCHGRVR